MKRQFLTAAAMMLVVASLAPAQSVPKAAPGSDAQPVAVMLEQAIYQEETAGNLEAAAKTYRQIVEQAAVGRALVAQALARLAALEVRQKQLDEARQTIERLKTEYPEQKDSIAKAEALLPDGGRSRLTQRYAGTGISEHEDSPQATAHVPTAEETAQAAELAKQGWQQYHDGKFKLATESFERATQLNPKLIDAWNGLGWAYLSQQQPSGSDFAKALELDPKNAVALNGMGWTMWRQSTTKPEAIKYWQQAVEADPTATSPISGLAQNALDTNDFEEAVKWYEKWLQCDPKNADAGLGLDHARAGQKVVTAAVAAVIQFLKKLDDGPFSDATAFVRPDLFVFKNSRGQIGFRTRNDDPSSEPQRIPGWEEYLKSKRESVGKVLERKIREVSYSPPWRTDRGSRRGTMNNPAGVGRANLQPGGGRADLQLPTVAILFETKFENKRMVVETVAVQETDSGEWKIVGYYIEETEIPRDPLKG